MSTLLRYLIVGGFFFMLGFSYKYHVPRFESWLIVKIEELSRQHLPVRILVGSAHLEAWPIGLRFQNIRLLPKGELTKTLAPVRIQSASFLLRPQSLLTGDFRLSEISIVKPEVTLIAKQNKSINSKNDLVFDFKELQNVPIQSLAIEDFNLQIRSDALDLSSRLEDVDINIDHRNQSFLVDINADKAFLKRRTGKEKIADISFHITSLVEEESVVVRGFKLRFGNSFLVGSGNVAGRWSQAKIDTTNLKSRSSIELVPVLETAKIFFPQLELPEISGSLETDIEVSKQKNTDLKVAGLAKTKKLKIQQFWLDRIFVNAEFADRTIKGHSIKAESSSGIINIDNALFNIDSQSLSGIVSANNIDLRKLLINLDVGDTPIHLKVNGRLPCEGTFKPLLFNCKGEVSGQDFEVYARNENKEKTKTIVALKNFGVSGRVEVDDKEVRFPEAKITIGDSIGEATGVVGYKTGFDFKFSSAELDFKNVQSLADLKIDGKLQLKGSTSGNSDSAIFGFKTKTNQLWFEDYGLGNASADVNYKSSMLYFKDVEGLFNTTKYFAQVTVDLDKNRVKAEGRLGFAEARDLQNIFSRRVQLPFEIFGNATAKVVAHGPFEFNRLSYELDTAVYKGSLGVEQFDEARFHVKSENGEVRTQRAYIKKGAGTATLVGEGHPSGQIEATITGQGFKLEDLGVLSQGGLTLSGDLNFSATMKGHVLSPDTQIQGRVSQSFVGREQVPDSDFDITLKRTGIDLMAQALGNKVSIDLQYPFTDTSPFRLRAKTDKWNFAPLFSLLSRDVAVREFDTELSGIIDLSAPTGGPWKSSGKIDVASLRIRRGSLELFNPQPGLIVFDNGKMTIKNASLQGDNTFLKAEANESSYERLNFNLNGKVEMGLLAFLTPFFSDMRGVLSISTQLSGTGDKPNLIGSAFVDKGYAKLKELIHPFENIRLDVLFNQDRLLINSFLMNFASGNVIGDGIIELKGYRDFPTQLRGKFDKVSLQIPQDFSTQGYGDFKITGSWFPFLLAGNYFITKGNITREVAADDGTAGIKRSNFLPDSLLMKSSAPMRLDLRVDFPSQLRLKNSLIDSEATGQLQIRGTPEDPVLLGEVQLPPGGQFFFRDIPFEVQNGSAKFDNPNKLNPVLYGQASTRVREYDISLLLQGTKENYQISLRSTPALAEQEIISLLALGYTSEQLESVKSDEQINQQSYEIGSALLLNNPLGNQIKDKYGVNVRFSSAVDESNNVSPKVIVSKQWTPRVGTSASRTIGNNSKQDVKLEYQLDRNVSVVGSWEGREFEEESNLNQNEKKNSDVFGLDLQYKVEFK